MTRTRTLSIALLALFAATAAFASWYDDYDAGLASVRKGDWPTVITKMSAAIKAHPNEGNAERTYGMITSNYHPYYYRGLAYLNLGRNEEAIRDLETTSGPGPIDRGSIEALMQKAKSGLAAPAAPEPQPAPVQPQPQPRPVVPAPAPAPVPVPLPVQPPAPAIDPALRQQVAGEIANAKARMTAAQQRKASGAAQYTQATQALADANTRSATAKSNDELRAALASAQNAALLFDAAAAAPPTAVAQQPASRPSAASTLVLGDTTRRVRQALQLYFNGEFEDAARAFGALTNDMPNNGWIYAFLGASQYSVYAFEIDESYRTKAYESFRQARRYGKFKNGLPEKYFSKRIRRAFEQTAVQ